MKRLLFIAHRLPYPPDKGERVRAFHEIKALAEHFRITLASLTHSKQDLEAAAGLKPWCQEIILAPAGGRAGLMRGALGMLRGRSLTQGYFRSRRLGSLLRQARARDGFDLVFGYSSSTLQFVLGVAAPARVMDLVDVDSAKWTGYAEDARRPVSWLYRREARAVRALERRALERCDAVLLVSDAEARALDAAGRKVFVVGNGVDTEYFSLRPPGAKAGPSLVFTGTMDYRPNVQGVCWFAREVWPGLKRTVPELTFTIVGRSPTRPVRQLARLPGVAVTGSVPDVRPFLAAASVAVCPLRIARGVQNKVLEAMAAALPVVASGPALEGLDVDIGKELLQADTPAQWQDSIVRLLEDDALRDRLGLCARRCAEARYSWAVRMAPLVSLCERLAGVRGPASPASPPVEADSADGAPLTWARGPKGLPGGTARR